MKIKILKEDNYPDWIWSTTSDPNSPVYDVPEPGEAEENVEIDFKFALELKDGQLVEYEDLLYDQEDEFESIKHPLQIVVEYNDYEETVIDKIINLNEVENDGKFVVSGDISIPANYTVYSASNEFDDDEIDNVEIRTWDAKLSNVKVEKVD